ncbi:MAG: ester cyclase [Thermoproteota archaeon]|nr:ester cyclase [Thermoproteota archaeon]
MASAPQNQQREEENKQVIREFFELLDQYDIERMGQLLVASTNYSFHPSGMPPLDWNGHKQLLTAVTRAFPDLHHNIIDMVAEGNKVAVRMNVTGTHRSEFHGIRPSGRSLSLDEIAFITVVDGKITEGWIISDRLSFMQQIGALPADTEAHANDGGGNTSANSNENSSYSPDDDNNNINNINND